MGPLLRPRVLLAALALAIASVACTLSASPATRVPLDATEIPALTLDLPADASAEDADAAIARLAASIDASTAAGLAEAVEPQLVVNTGGAPAANNSAAPVVAQGGAAPSGGVVSLPVPPANTVTNKGGVPLGPVISYPPYAPCVVRSDWPVTTVQRGDTLFRIAQRTGSSVGALTVANCLPNPNLIYVGQHVRVPRLPTVPTVPPPAHAAITINPGTGSVTLDGQGGFTVTGRARGVTNGTLFVQARNALGGVVASASATRTGTLADGSITWQATLRVPFAHGDYGVVTAFGTNAAGGQVVSNTVGLVFHRATTPQPSAFVRIDSPRPAPPQTVVTVPLDASNRFVVRGTGGALFEGNVVVQAQDATGRVIDQRATILQSPNAGTGGSGPWEVTLGVGVGDVGRAGRVVAFSTSARDGSVVASDAVAVQYGSAPQPAPFITLSQPADGSTLPISGAASFGVSGRSGNLLGAVIVVQALDAANAVFSEQRVVANADGTWSATLSVPVGQLGVFGRVSAFSVSQLSGLPIARADARVTFGSAPVAPPPTQPPPPLAATQPLLEPLPTATALPFSE